MSESSCDDYHFHNHNSEQLLYYSLCPLDSYLWSFATFGCCNPFFTLSIKNWHSWRQLIYPFTRETTLWKIMNKDYHILCKESGRVKLHLNPNYFAFYKFLPDKDVIWYFDIFCNKKIVQNKSLSCLLEVLLITF